MAFSDDESRASPNPIEAGDMVHFPWGKMRARDGRKLLSQPGKTSCSNEEIALGQALVTNWWICGQGAWEWKMWPEADNVVFAEVIVKCWEMVGQYMLSNNFQANPLDQVVARKVGSFL
jgi:hypothetical protein